MLLNSEFSVELARHFASRVLQEVGREPEAWITHGYRLALGRSPGAEERRVAHAFLRRQSQVIRDEKRPAEQVALPYECPKDVDRADAAALTDFCHALLNLSELVYVD